MLFVHPNPMDRAAWMYQMAHLSTWFRCLAVDLPGYGASPAASGGLTLADLAHACWEVLDDAARGEAAVLVGCSVGSLVVAQMSRERSSLTRALVLAGTGLWPDDGWQSLISSRMAAFREQGVSFRGPYVLAEFSADFRRMPLGRFLADVFASREHLMDLNAVLHVFEAIRPPLPVDFFSSISCPSLILSGTEDGSHAFAPALCAAIPDCELRVLPGAGHACQLQMPWLFDQFVVEFLQRRGILAAERP